MTADPHRPDPESVFPRFHDRTLPKPEWTHEAHLAVCWMQLKIDEPAGAVDVLRDAISSYNEATGVANTETDGYHESITRFYVWAVASMDADTFDDVLTHPLADRAAALQFWSRDVLFTPEARLGWVPPDRAPLPWTAGLSQRDAGAD